MSVRKGDVRHAIGETFRYFQKSLPSFLYEFRGGLIFGREVLREEGNPR
jgi:hypothetical protein